MVETKADGFEGTQVSGRENESVGASGKQNRAKKSQLHQSVKVESVEKVSESCSE